jgi:hypothetical protein
MKSSLYSPILRRLNLLRSVKIAPPTLLPTAVHMSPCKSPHASNYKPSGLLQFVVCKVKVHVGPHYYVRLYEASESSCCADSTCYKNVPPDD